MNRSGVADLDESGLPGSPNANQKKSKKKKKGTEKILPYD
jgi:hypothetical protein